jgi:hypothetical protein
MWTQERAGTHIPRGAFVCIKLGKTLLTTISRKTTKISADFSGHCPVAPVSWFSQKRGMSP